MSSFDFKGDVESITQEQFEFIGKILHERGFKGPDVLLEQVGSAGDNYVANVKRVIILENGKTFKMIAKLASSNLMMREMGNLEMLFHNEHVVYTELLPKFRELEVSAGVPEGERFRFAECYGSKREVPHEVILLEDLNEDDYVMLDRFKPLNNDCVNIVMKNLAIFHSLSYVLKQREPEKYAEFKGKLNDMFTGPKAKTEEFNQFFSQMEDNTLAILQDDKYKKYIKGNVAYLIHHATEVMKVDADSKYSIIQQGDGWTNNILFQMEGESPKSCILIDYQVARESSPAYDIMYSLFNSTSHVQRHAHYNHFLDHYHREMHKSLQRHGLDATSVYPRHQLDSDLKRYAKFMLSVSVMISTFIIRNNEDASMVKEAFDSDPTGSASADMEKVFQAMHMEDKDTIKLFKNKVEGIIDSFLEFGLLQE